MSKAIFAGSFDPPTKGHKEIVKKAASIFEAVYVVVFINPDKEYMFPTDERKKMLSDMLADIPGVRVDSCDGYVTDYAHAHGIDVIVRGIRDEKDTEYELSLARAYRDMAPDISVVFIPADREYEHVSSTLVREKLAKGEDISNLI